MMTEITLRLEKIGVIPVIAIEHINHALGMADALIVRMVARTHSSSSRWHLDCLTPSDRSG